MLKLKINLVKIVHKEVDFTLPQEEVEKIIINQGFIPGTRFYSAYSYLNNKTRSKTIYTIVKSYINKDKIMERSLHNDTVIPGDWYYYYPETGDILAFISETGGEFIYYKKKWAKIVN